MTDLLAVMHQITRPWVQVIAPDTPADRYRSVDHYPRLVMLKEAVRASTGGTEAGRTTKREAVMVNLAALTLLESIEDHAAGTLLMIGYQPMQKLGERLEQLGQVADTLRSTNQMTIRDHERLIEKYQNVVHAIDTIFDPPRVKRIEGPCPNCGQTHYFNEETGVRDAAIIAYFWEGHQPVASCQRCQAQWQTDRELLELGYSVHANVDHDTLRKMGVA